MTIVSQPAQPRTERRLILRATEVPDECIKRAQAVIITESAWHLIAPLPWKLSCLKDMDIPETVTCPIVDISALPEELDTQVAQVIAENYSLDSGVTNLPALLAGLVQLGAVVTNRPCADCAGETMDCNDCMFLEEE